MLLTAETLAFLDRMETAPSDADAFVIDQAIRSLKVAGVWQKLDALYFPFAANEQAATLNWVSEDYTLVVTRTGSNMPFTPYRGWVRANAFDGYINTGYSPATAGGLLTQNSACIGFHCVTSDDEFVIDMGVSTSGLALAFSGSFGGNRVSAINDNSGLLNAAPTRNVGHHAASRIASGEYHVYHDNYDTTTVQTQASTGLPAGPIFLGAWNLDGTAGNRTNRRYGCAHIGAGLTVAELQAFSRIIETYLSMIGTTGCDVFVVAGQSNANFGLTSSRILDTVTADVLQLRTGDYPGAYVDKADFPDRGSGSAAIDPISWALPFARDWYEPNRLEAGRRILIVPCAYGGSGIVNDPLGWLPPTAGLYLEAIRRANVAMGLPGSRFKGFLWLQGEYEASAGSDPTAYAAALDSLIAGLRDNITGAENAPFVLGQMPPGWANVLPSTRGAIQTVITNTPSRVARTAVASASVPSVLGTTDLHYVAADHRAYGLRFGAAWATLSSEPATDSSTDGTQTLEPTTRYIFPNTSAVIPITVPVPDGADTGPYFTISKNGGAFADPAAGSAAPLTVVAFNNNQFAIPLAAGDTDTEGPLRIRVLRGNTAVYKDCQVQAIPADMRAINHVTLEGDGSTTPWGPA